MKIYTKTGDKGTTSLLGGTRVSKADLKIDAYGSVDELNAWIGLLRDLPSNHERADLLVAIQNNLFSVGSHLAQEAGNAKFQLPEVDTLLIGKLESAMDDMNESLPELRNFVLPGGHVDVSYCQVARTVCRRAERKVIALNKQEEVSSVIITLLNRLSDYLFVLGRKLTAELSAEETIWKPTS